MDWLQSFATVLLFSCSVLQPKASAARIRTCTHKSPMIFQASVEILSTAIKSFVQRLVVTQHVDILGCGLQLDELHAWCLAQWGIFAVFLGEKIGLL